MNRDQSAFFFFRGKTIAQDLGRTDILTDADSFAARVR